VALTTFSDLVTEARERIHKDAQRASLPDDPKPLATGGTGPTAYAEAVSVYLGIGVNRLCDRTSSLCSWDVGYTKIRNTFGRQALPMVWDYCEGNPFSESTGNFEDAVTWIVKVVNDLPSIKIGQARHADAQTQNISKNRAVSSDPPYYDNIGYADLSDFFYVWLRRTLQPVFPNLFSTLSVPKTEELVATPYRHGGKEAAETFFLNGMTQAMHRLAEQAHPAFPVTIYYAFKQSEKEGADGTSSTGWETFLEAVIKAGFTITGTWPMRTELSNRMIGSGTNALASSIVLVCRARPADASVATRREFIATMRAELPAALRALQGGNIAPVDLAQAAIGPGMAVYSRYASVRDAEGKSLSVREALVLINQILDESLAEQESEFDSDTRWALAWFDQQGFDEGPYGTAETLATAKNTSIAGLVESGMLQARAGKVRLLKPEELPKDWNPATDTRLTVWEMTHHLVRLYHTESAGELATAALLRQLGGQADIARDLAYRLFSVCERRKRSAEAQGYNALVQGWPDLAQLARSAPPKPAAPAQGELL
jgi:putative DNA methylase